MKYFIIILLLTSCGYQRPKESNFQSTDESEKFYELNGVIEFNMLAISSSDTPIKILNLDSTVFAEFYNTKFKIKGSIYDWIDDNVDTIKSLINIPWFFPDYWVMVTDCIGETKDIYKIVVGKSIKFVNKNDLYLKFFSYKDFISKRTFQLDNNCPLRMQPNDSAIILLGYDNYSSYQIIEFSKEWVKVKPDSVLYGNHDYVGWTRWEKDKKLQINKIHFSY